MNKRRWIILAGGLLIALAAALYWGYTAGFISSGERPTLIYFRADL